MARNNYDEMYYPENLEETLTKNVDERMITHIVDANRNNLHSQAMSFMGLNVSYDELFANICKYAMALKKYGISKGDIVTIVMPNVPETIYYFYACNAIGATAYLIDPRFTFSAMSECIKRANSPLLICESGNYYKKVAKNLDRLPVDNVIVASPVNSLEIAKDRNTKQAMAAYVYKLKQYYERLLAQSKDNSKEMSHQQFLKNAAKYAGENNIEKLSEPYDPETPAIIVNTSGTSNTGIKGAMHYDRSYNIYTNQIPYITKELVRGYTYYGYVPYFSMYGSAVGMHTALSKGIVIDNIPKFKGKKSLQQIIDSKSNILIGVPGLFEKLSLMYEREDADAHHVKIYVVGGDNIAPSTLNQINDNLLSRGMSEKVIFGYGATETFPTFTTSFDERSQVSGSVGIPYPGVNFKIVDPETLKEVSDGVEGEIYESTLNMMKGYLGMPDETEKVFTEIDGIKYFKTGDKGYKTENGILFITGRYKALMKRPDGHQTNPIPIENAITACDLVDSCAVVGIKRNGQNNGEIPTAFVVLKDRKQIEKNGKLGDAISIIARESLERLSGEREAALAYVVVDDIPKTENGKTHFVQLGKNTFDSLVADGGALVVIDDPVTREYFQGMNVKIVKYKGIGRTLNKK